MKKRKPILLYITTFIFFCIPFLLIINLICWLIKEWKDFYYTEI